MKRLPAVLCIALASTLLTGCVTPGTGGGGSAPGLYNLTGWNNDFPDVNGQVGYRMFVQGPTAECRPSGQWSGAYSIVSGDLPPGLSIDNGYNITGIPTERGHWIVRLRNYDIHCNDSTYEGFEQELRFHITGSGQVIQ